VSVNKPFKDNVGKLYIQWMAKGGHELMPTGKIRRLSIEMMCNWIVRAWNIVSTKIITKSFLKVGIMNTLDGSEDDMLTKMCMQKGIVNWCQRAVPRRQ
jgi:hypothetical protein